MLSQLTETQSRVSLRTFGKERFRAVQHDTGGTFKDSSVTDFDKPGPILAKKVSMSSGKRNRSMEERRLACGASISVSSFRRSEEVMDRGTFLERWRK